MATNRKGLLWITRGGAVECKNPAMALVSGFLRVLRNEYVGRRFITLDLDPSEPAWTPSEILPIVHVMKTRLGGRDDGPSSVQESEFALRDGLILVPRIYKDITRNRMISPDAVDGAVPESIPEAALFQPQRPLRLHR